MAANCVSTVHISTVLLHRLLCMRLKQTLVITGVFTWANNNKKANERIVPNDVQRKAQAQRERIKLLSAKITGHVTHYCLCNVLNTFPWRQPTSHTQLQTRVQEPGCRHGHDDITASPHPHIITSAPSLMMSQHTQPILDGLQRRWGTNQQQLLWGSLTPISKLKAESYW